MRPGPAGNAYCPPGTQTVIPPASGWQAGGVCEAVPAQPAWRPEAGRTVVVDAGHGGSDEGTKHFGLREKDVNLDLAIRTANLLRARGCNVVMTRTADHNVSLADRSAAANRNPNAVFVSIHCNAVASNPGVSGVETFVLSGDISDQQRAAAAAGRYRANGYDAAAGQQALATLAANSRAKGPALAGSLQRSLTRRLGENDRGVKSKNLAVLRETYFGPAALVEVGFMTNPQTAERMRTEEWRRRTSEALCEGVCDFLRTAN